MLDAAVNPALGKERGLSMRAALLVTFVVAMVAHMLWLGGTVLVVTADSVDYYNTAHPLYAEGKFTITYFRTPGYPLLLTLSYWLFGLNGLGVMIMQHALSVVVSLCLVSIAGRFVKPWLAMAAGVLYSVNPITLGLASVMLTESVSIFFFIFPIWCILCWRSRPKLAAFVALAFFGYALLVRPATQVAFPFVLAATLVGPGIDWKSRLKTLGVGLAGFTMACAPWLAYNANRGHKGFARGGDAALWISLVQQDLLDKDYPLPDFMERQWAPVKPKVGASAEMWAFLLKPTEDPKQLPQVRKVMKDWARHSLKQNFKGYLRRLPYSLAWQMNYFPDHTLINTTQYTWFCWMLALDNTQLPPHPGMHHGLPNHPTIAKMGMVGHGGWVRPLMQWWGLHQKQLGGIPEIPLCLLSIGAGVIAIRRRDWRLVLCLLASASIVGIHIVMIFHQSRYSLPPVALWHATGMITVAAMFPSLRGRWWVETEKGKGRTEPAPANDAGSVIEAKPLAMPIPAE
jgi:4-amino-4-deoxy-L-arabinose transferase-like glycosyltransferase